MAYPPDVERWRPLVSQYFRPEDVDKALYVIMYESGGNHTIAGDGGNSIGLFQEHRGGGLGSGYSVEELQDPETNIRIAAQAVYGGSGWGPWGEGTTYQGQPFGALGNHPYGGGTQIPGPPHTGEGGMPPSGDPFGDDNTGPSGTTWGPPQQSSDGRWYQVGSNGKIAYLPSPPQQSAPGAPTTIKGVDGNIYQWDPSAGTWTPSPGLPKAGEAPVGTVPWQDPNTGIVYAVNPNDVTDVRGIISVPKADGSGGAEPPKVLQTADGVFQWDPAAQKWIPAPGISPQGNGGSAAYGGQGTNVPPPDYQAMQAAAIAAAERSQQQKDQHDIDMIRLQAKLAAKEGDEDRALQLQAMADAKEAENNRLRQSTARDYASVISTADPLGHAVFLSNTGLGDITNDNMDTISNSIHAGRTALTPEALMPAAIDYELLQKLNGEAVPGAAGGATTNAPGGTGGAPNVQDAIRQVQGLLGGTDGAGGMAKAIRRNFGLTPRRQGAPATPPQPAMPAYAYGTDPAPQVWDTQRGQPVAPPAEPQPQPTGAGMFYDSPLTATAKGPADVGLSVGGLAKPVNPDILSQPMTYPAQTAGKPYQYDPANASDAFGRPFWDGITTGGAHYGQSVHNVGKDANGRAIWEWVNDSTGQSVGGVDYTGEYDYDWGNPARAVSGEAAHYNPDFKSRPTPVTGGGGNNEGSPGGQTYQEAATAADGYIDKTTGQWVPKPAGQPAPGQSGGPVANRGIDINRVPKGGYYTITAEDLVNNPLDVSLLDPRVAAFDANGAKKTGTLGVGDRLVRFAHGGTTAAREMIIGDPQVPGQVNPEHVTVENPGEDTRLRITPLQDMKREQMQRVMQGIQPRLEEQLGRARQYAPALAGQWQQKFDRWSSGDTQGMRHAWQPVTGDLPPGWNGIPSFRPPMQGMPGDPRMRPMPAMPEGGRGAAPPIPTDPRGMGPGGVNSGFGKPAYPGGPINNDWSDPSDPRLNQPPSNKPMPVGLPSTGLPSRLPGGLPNDGVAQPYQPQPITRDGRTYMPGPRPTTGDFAPDNTLDRHTAEALPHYAFGTGIGGFNPMKMIQKVIGGLPAAGQAPAQQAVNGLPSMTPTPTMPVSPGSPAVTPIAQPPATPPATGGAGAGSTPAGTPPAGAAPTSTLTRRAERMARHAAGAAPPPPVSPANPPPSPQPVTSTQDGPLVSPVGGGQGPLPGMTPPSQETLDMIRKLREGTIVPNLNPYDVNWNQIDPAVKAAYYQAMQSKFGVPIEAQQWEQQKYALAGIDGRSSGY